MKKVIINQNQKGFLFKNGKFVKLLDAGKYYTFGNKEIDVFMLSQEIACAKCSLETLLLNERISKLSTVVQVDDQNIALHFVNGKFNGVLRAGKHAFWTVEDKHEFITVDISSPEVSSDVPTYVFEKISLIYYVKVDVAPYQKARLFFDNKLQRILEPGTYYFWKNNVKIDVDYVDTRLLQMDINGQEILTKDKVAVRVNFVCNYKITDCVKILSEIDDYKEQLHVLVQLALREYVGRYKIDEILENKDVLSEDVFNKIKQKQDGLYLEVKEAGIKDIILPGEIREIMNTVLVAEKRAQANIITRREEIASTRSLLNTAKLMEENKTLYKLKELEYVERICSNVGNINVSGGDLLSQLKNVLRAE